MANQVTTLRMGQKFKKTPAGEVPVDWDICELGQVAKSTANSFVAGPFGSELKVSDYTEEGIRLIQLQNIGDGFFNSDNEKYTSKTKFQQLRVHAAYPGDILIAKMADPVARACLAPNIAHEYLLVADCVRVAVDESKYDTRFVLYAINNEVVRSQALARSTGTTRLRITLTALRSLQMPAPPLQEQKKIAEILSAVDDAIEHARIFSEKTGNLKQDLLQKLLLRGIGKKKFQNSKWGDIPFEWEVAKLGDLCLGKPEYGANVPAQDHIVGLPRYVRITDIAVDGNLVKNDPKGISKSEAEPYLLREGDVLFARSGATVGKTYLYQRSDGPCAFAGYLIKFQPSPTKLLPEHLFQFTHSNPYYKWVKSMLRAGAQPNINATEYAELQLPIPSIDEQRNILDILHSMDDSLVQQRRAKERLEDVKRGLLHVLLTGKVRVVGA